MKTCDEMLESVLCRAKKDITKRNNIRKTALMIGTTGLCLMLILGLTLVPWSGEQPVLPTDGHIAAPPATTNTTQDTTRPTGIERPSEFSLSFLTVTDTRASQSYLPADVCMPVDITLRVCNLAGLTGEERNQAVREEMAAIEALRAEIYAYEDGSVSFRKSDIGIVALLSKGCISLCFADDEQVSSVDAESLEGLSGGKMIYHTDYTVGEGEEQITYPAGSVRYFFNWRLSTETEWLLMGNLNMKLSTISDTIKITVNYKNGYRETILVDVSVSDEGQVYMTLRGNNA